MQPNMEAAAISPSAAPRTASGNAERCKHDLLLGQCGFCPVASWEPLGHVSGQEFGAWLGRFTPPSQSGLPTQRTNHERPQPGASAGSTANPAISRRRQ
jgi:hypothetical protein